jgi:hypothetical protein
MRIPQDASLDVKAFAREVMQEIADLRSRFVLLDGSRMTGAGDAVTLTGLVTLRQLQGSEDRAISKSNAIEAEIAQLKADNDLV